MFNNFSKEQRKKDELLYTVVTEEIERNEIHKALWTKSVADSDNNKERAQALYIKYRVQKLKDEISDQEEEQRATEKVEKTVESKLRKASKNLEILDNTVARSVSTFQYLISAMVLLSFGILFFAYLFYDSGEPFELWALSGLILMFLGFYLFYLYKRVIKTTDHIEIRKRLNVLFFILIPFSLIGTAIGILLPIAGMFMFIAFILLIIRAYKFNSAFSYAKRNGLL